MASRNPITRYMDRFVAWLGECTDNRFLSAIKREIRVIIQVARAIQNEEISRRAAALTYHTLLSLVPLLAVAFALFKAFGGFEKLKGPFEEYIFSQLAIPNAERVADWLESFVDQVNGGAIASVGLLVLFYSAGGLLTNIENAFNRIWNVKMRRPLYVRLAIYWCILTLAPPILALSISFSTTFINETVGAWMGDTAADIALGLIAPVSIALMFLVVYVIVPDTHVPLKDAAIAALVAAVSWNVAKAAFLWSTRASSNYSAIYGALSALPLLMIWIFISWSIVLFGVAYAKTRGDVKRVSQDPEAEPSRPTPRLVARVLVATWEHFRAGRSITAESISESIALPTAVCRRTMDLLVDRGFLEYTGTEKREGAEYLLRRHIGDLSLIEVDTLLADPRSKAYEARVATSPMWQGVEERFRRAEGARKGVLGVTLEEATRQDDPDRASRVPAA